MIDKEQILQWFAHECDSTPEEGAGDETEWVLTGKMGGLGTTIICPKGKDFIQIQRGIRIADDHKTIISGRSKDRQAEFHYNLKRGLLSTGARWQLMFSDEAEADLDEVRISNRLFEDGLSRDAFQQKLMQVHDASVLLFIELRHILSE